MWDKSTTKKYNEDPRYKYKVENNANANATRRPSEVQRGEAMQRQGF